MLWDPMAWSWVWAASTVFGIREPPLMETFRVGFRNRL